MDNKYTRKDINEYTHEFELTIPFESFKHSYELMLKDYSKDLDLKGFRKGKVPSNLVSPQVKEVVKYETFEKLAPLYINTAVEKEKLQPIAPYEFKEIPKFLENLDIPFTITVTTMPKFTLGNMKKVKVTKEVVSIDEKEIDQAIEELKTSQKTETKEVNDAWAKEIGKEIGEETITTLKELREKIKSALQVQKEHYQMHRMQDQALKLAIKESKIEIPQPAVNFEASEREKAFNEDMKSRGVSIDDFLKANNITIEKMRELWQMDAKEAIESDVFLSLFAETKEVQVSDEELEEKIESIKKERPDADQSVFSNLEWREYVKRVEVKEKAFRLFIEEVLGKEFLDSHN